MEVIKLQKTDSTNDFLKNYNNNQVVSNFTVVSAVEQTKGKGQRQNKWISEPSKNLTFSILIKDIAIYSLNIFSLNIIISNCLHTIINKYISQKLFIKWPNDIYVKNKKLAGILIELSHKKSKQIDAVIGIGLNVNQTNFNNTLRATSIKNESQQNINLDNLLIELTDFIKIKIQDFNKVNFLSELENYNQHLYKKNIPSVFKTKSNETIMGIIKQVSLDGKIHIMNESEQINSYRTGDIQFIGIS